MVVVERTAGTGAAADEITSEIQRVFAVTQRRFAMGIAARPAPVGVGVGVGRGWDRKQPLKLTFLVLRQLLLGAGELLAG